MEFKQMRSQNQLYDEYRKFMSLPMFNDDVFQQVEFDTSPILFSEMTPVSKIHYYFAMLDIDQVFVARKGILLGVFTKDDLYPDVMATLRGQK